MDGRRCTSARAVTGDASGLVSAEWLIGTWQLLRCEAPLEIEPGTRMHFATDDRLEYSIPTADRPLQVTLQWRLEGDILHTQHADGSNPVQVRVTHGEADVMTFDFDGARAWFVRAR
jgi:hypothetical protein